MMKKGDRVRLTARAARSAAEGYCRLRRKHPPDWLHRCGTVQHTPGISSGNVLVIWDGLKGHDSRPKAALEPIDADR
jgi:hypothetical protein